MRVVYQVGGGREEGEIIVDSVTIGAAIAITGIKKSALKRFQHLRDIASQRSEQVFRRKDDEHMDVNQHVLARAL